MKLEDILRRPEGKTLEYKRDFSSAAPALRTLVADRIVTFIREGNGRSTAEIATHAGLSTRATQPRLAAGEETRP